MSHSSFIIVLRRVHLTANHLRIHLLLNRHLLKPLPPLVLMKTRSQSSLGLPFPLRTQRPLTMVRSSLNHIKDSYYSRFEWRELTAECYPHVSLLFVGEKPNALAEPRGEEESLTKKGKKKKAVHWAEEEQLKHYFYFDLDETERGERDSTRPSRMLILLTRVCLEKVSVIKRHLSSLSQRQ